LPEFIGWLWSWPGSDSECLAFQQPMAMKWRPLSLRPRRWCRYWGGSATPRELRAENGQASRILSVSGGRNERDWRPRLMSRLRTQRPSLRRPTAKGHGSVRQIGVIPGTLLGESPMLGPSSGESNPSQTSVLLLLIRCGGTSSRLLRWALRIGWHCLSMA
jgi:hypothetical protein